MECLGYQNCEGWIYGMEIRLFFKPVSMFVCPPQEIYARMVLRNRFVLLRARPSIFVVYKQHTQKTASVPLMNFDGPGTTWSGRVLSPPSLVPLRLNEGK